MELIRFSESFSIAIHGLAHLSNIYPERMTGKKLAMKIGAHENTLAKVFQKLARKGIVGSERGPKGGFFITGDNLDLSFLEIFEAVEGDISEQGCPMGREECPFAECVMGSGVNKISNELKNLFKDKTLADLAGRL